MRKEEVVAECVSTQVEERDEGAPLSPLAPIIYHRPASDVEKEGGE